MSQPTSPLHDRETLVGLYDAVLREPGWRRHDDVISTLSTLAHPVVRARVALAARPEVVWRFLVVDVVDTMGSWNEAYGGGEVLSDDGAGVRRIVTRARLPRPFRDREDDFEQHAFVDDGGVYWELSRCAPPRPPTKGYAAGRVWLAGKQVAPDSTRGTGDGCVVDILWYYQLGGALDLLPWRVRERALADNLRHECDRLRQRFGAAAP